MRAAGDPESGPAFGSSRRVWCSPDRQLRPPQRACRWGLLSTQLPGKCLLGQSPSAQFVITAALPIPGEARRS